MIVAAVSKHPPQVRNDKTPARFPARNQHQLQGSDSQRWTEQDTPVCWYASLALKYSLSTIGGVSSEDLSSDHGDNRVPPDARQVAANQGTTYCGLKRCPHWNTRSRVHFPSAMSPLRHRPTAEVTSVSVARYDGTSRFALECHSIEPPTPDCSVNLTVSTANLPLTDQSRCESGGVFFLAFLPELILSLSSFVSAGNIGLFPDGLASSGDSGTFQFCSVLSPSPLIGFSRDHRIRFRRKIIRIAGVSRRGWRQRESVAAT